MHRPTLNKLHFILLHFILLHHYCHCIYYYYYIIRPILLFLLLLLYYKANITIFIITIIL